ncbi:unnamed protein product [Leuciscus chuanchicus]
MFGMCLACSGRTGLLKACVWCVFGVFPADRTAEGVCLACSGRTGLLKVDRTAEGVCLACSGRTGLLKACVWRVFGVFRVDRTAEGVCWACSGRTGLLKVCVWEDRTAEGVCLACSGRTGLLKACVWRVFVVFRADRTAEGVCLARRRQQTGENLSAESGRYEKDSINSSVSHKQRALEIHPDSPYTHTHTPDLLHNR